MRPVARRYSDPFSMHDIGFGLVPGRKIINKFGRNPKISIATVPEDVWQGGDLYSGFDLAAAETVNVASASANDALAGSGAQRLFISGLLGDYSEAEEIMELDGTTAVVSANAYIRLNRAYCLGSGTLSRTASNNGDLALDPSATGSGSRFALIVAGFGQTQIAAYTVPLGYEALVTNVYAVTRRGASGTWQREIAPNLMTRAMGECWRSQRPTSGSPASPTQVSLDGGIRLAAKTDMVLRIDDVSHNNTAVAGGFDVHLRKTG